jgi:hypothetical protein
MILIQEEKMKRFWLMMLSWGLVMAFTASAFAVDVKVSGEFYVGGLNLNKISVADNYSWTVTDSNNNKTTYTGNPGTAFFYQRLRMEADFIVDPSLKLVTRFDALERIWGGARSAPGTAAASDSAGTRAENENIAFDWAYIDYVSPIGIFDVGLMEDGRTGTVFGNSYTTLGRIKWKNTFGAFTLAADITKSKDQSYSAVTTTTNFTDGDNTKYGLEGVYAWKDGKGGMKVAYYNYDEKSPSTNPLSNSGDQRKRYFVFTPYAIAKIGPVDLQTEVNWASGKIKYDNNVLNADGLSEVSIDNLSGWIDATVNFAPVYAGATIAYVSGDDPGTKDKQEGGTLNGGQDWNPCLILFNYYDVANWVGTVSGYDSSKVTGPMSNAWFFQGRAGVKPVANLDIMASVSYATADKKPSDFTGGTYGTEVDLTGTYKITSNLSYMLGVGYLFTGDYFKGKNGNNKIDDDYMLINKLTLTF